MDGTGRTFDHAFAAQAAFLEVDIGKIVLYLDGTERAGLFALAAADTGHLARLAGNGTFLHIDA